MQLVDQLFFVGRLVAGNDRTFGMHFLVDIAEGLLDRRYLALGGSLDSRSRTTLDDLEDDMFQEEQMFTDLSSRPSIFTWCGLKVIIWKCVYRLDQLGGRPGQIVDDLLVAVHIFFMQGINLLGVYWSEAGLQLEQVL